MKREHITAALFLLITGIFCYLFYRIIVPFFVPISWAAVLVIIFFPLYERLRDRLRRPSVASLLMCLLILALIVGPIAYLFVALVKEAADAVVEVENMYRSGRLEEILSIQMPWIDMVKEKLVPYYDLSKINLDEMARDAVDRVSGIILGQTSWLVANATKAVFYFVLMIFSMYYFFLDGERVIARVKRLMPLAPEQINSTFNHLREVVQATMYGGGVVALFQGFLGGIMFVIFGISSPIFWGAIMALLSAIPFLGAFVIYIPAGIILILGGHYIKGILIIGIGTIIISQVDNLLRPYLISGRTQMHPLLLFFSILGGIAVFGLLGLVIGPLIAAIFDALIKILEFRLHPEKPDAATE